jgi:transposase InsO family protein
MGIRDRPTALRSPWQNGYCERLIGSIRRECLDHIVVFGERHLRHLLRSYANYYNRTRHRRAGILLVAFNWPEHTERYQRVARFVDALFSRIDEFSKPPRHPKWKEASVSAVVPGWQRFKAAQDWINRWRAQHPDAANQASFSKFKDFIAREGHANMSQEELERVYAQFLAWNRRAKN